MDKVKAFVKKYYAVLLQADPKIVLAVGIAIGIVVAITLSRLLSG